jgi:hypothetical protein
MKNDNENDTPPISPDENTPPLALNISLDMSRYFPPVHLYYDAKAIQTALQYELLPPEKKALPLTRFWQPPKTLVAHCTQAIAATLVRNPSAFFKRAAQLPPELNARIDAALEEAQAKIDEERLESLTRLVVSKLVVQ